jgi:TRAP-type C4-dicarboxylate transport system permease small subunit
MKIQISRFSIRQTAKLVGAVHVVLASPLLLLGMVRLSTRSMPAISEISPIWLFLAPFIYGLGAYILALMMCLIYNFVARYFGGVEYTTSEKMVGE